MNCKRDDRRERRKSHADDEDLLSRLVLPSIRTVVGNAFVSGVLKIWTWRQLEINNCKGNGEAEMTLK